MRFDVNPLRPASSHDPRRRQTPAAQMPQRNRTALSERGRGASPRRSGMTVADAARGIRNMKNI
jgi:hypothetical protein